MTIIEFKSTICKFNATTNVISVNEINVPKFDTSYKVWNPITKCGVDFIFDHMTGSEWDPNTKSVYLATDNSGYILEIANDAEITNKRAQSYLKSKVG